VQSHRAGAQFTAEGFDGVHSALRANCNFCS